MVLHAVRFVEKDMAQWLERGALSMVLHAVRFVERDMAQ